ncbi:hypothetical protein EOM86_06845, partial [Candidatus Nomurabacteria bacterium]|nr:hypothetical protein [Candidatus Nomurabacteria bacterium]
MVLSDLNNDLKLGLDIGSTTVKVAVVENDKIIYSLYRRHNSDIRNELISCLGETADKFPSVSFNAAVTGSGGMSVSEWLGLQFVQEVIAGTQAVER